MWNLSPAELNEFHMLRLSQEQWNNLYMDQHLFRIDPHNRDMFDPLDEELD